VISLLGLGCPKQVFSENSDSPDLHFAHHFSFLMTAYSLNHCLKTGAHYKYLYKLFLNYFYERLNPEQEETSENYRCTEQVGGIQIDVLDASNQSCHNSKQNFQHILFCPHPFGSLFRIHSAA